MPYVVSGPPAAQPPKTLSLLPQFDAPFRLDPSGQPVVVEQDSPEEVGAAVLNVCVCPQGAKLADPTFGIPSPLFQTAPVQLGPILAALRRLEPRANVTGISELANVQQIVTALVGGLYPAGQIPGAEWVPHDPSIQQITTGGPLTNNVNLTAQVQER